MKKKIFASLIWSLSTLVAAGQHNILNYHLTWDGCSNYVDVTLDYQPSANDSTVFQFGLPGFGGQADIFNVVEALRCNEGDSMGIHSTRNELVIYHAQQAKHQLVYRINGTVNADNGDKAIYKELFRPVIGKGSVYLIPAFFMFYPQNGSAQEVMLHFEVPHDTPVFCSWAPEAGVRSEIPVPLSKSAEMLIVMGEDNQIKKYDVGGNRYYLITGKDNLDEVSPEMQRFFTGYFPSLRRFWMDRKKASFYIYVSKLQSTQLASQGGFVWGRGFIMKYQGQFNLRKKYTTAHETSHAWLRVQIGKNSFEHQWFGEGFNDYVCLINMFNAKIISQAELVRMLNDDFFKPHYTSSVNTVANDSIVSKYWSDKAYEKLPYRRGCIYAFYLDNQLRLASHNKVSLRNVLLALQKQQVFSDQDETHKNISLEDFIKSVSALLPGRDMKKDVWSHMIEGRLLDFSAIELCPEFKMSFTDGNPEISLPPGTDLSKFYKW